MSIKCAIKAGILAPSSRGSLRPLWFPRCRACSLNHKEHKEHKEERKQSRLGIRRDDEPNDSHGSPQGIGRCLDRDLYRASRPSAIEVPTKVRTKISTPVYHLVSRSGTATARCQSAKASSSAQAANAWAGLSPDPGVPITRTATTSTGCGSVKVNRCPSCTPAAVAAVVAG
jgi:hypothetical protein